MATPVNQDVNVVGEQAPSVKSSLLGLLRQKKVIIALLFIILIPLISLSLQKQPTKVTKGPAATPTPTQHSRMWSKAKQDMPVFLDSILKDEYVPLPQNASDVKETKDSNRLILTSILPSKEGLYASVMYKNSSTYYKKDINIILPAAESIPLSEKNAPTLTATYFKIQPKGIWKCGTIETKTSSSTICENFWTIKDQVKMGIGIINPSPGQTTGEKTNTNIFFCEIYKGSPLFENKSCNAYKKDTGI